MENIQRRIKQIKTENFIWIIYFFLIGLCLYANSHELKYFCQKNTKSKEIYRKLCIIIFIIAVIIYLYFFIDNYQDYQSLSSNEDPKIIKLNQLSLFGSGIVLISGLIFLYIAIVDENLDIEIAFN